MKWAPTKAIIVTKNPIDISFMAHLFSCIAGSGRIPNIVFHWCSNSFLSERCNSSNFAVSPFRSCSHFAEYLYSTLRPFERYFHRLECSLSSLYSSCSYFLSGSHSSNLNDRHNSARRRNLMLRLTEQSI